ncbi:MAG TPA: ABC transporter ATP-binding protein [Bacteroidales bacterium]|nr:ABC transporter ATP-binding protein [Bacteroidales bacterium]
MDTIIDIKGLTKQYPMGNNRFTALRDISISFAKGEFTGIIGPSGSGKTTLLNIIGTLDVPSEGEVLLLGRSVGKLSPKEAADLRKKSLGFIFQTYNLLPVYTVYENVEFPLLLLGLTEGMRRKMVMEALDWVGLASRADSRPSRLSGGECQRVAIARAMVKKPILVLADEPTANLDAANSHHILQTMERLNRELGTSFLFATHDEKVIGYVRRKVKLDDGRLAADEIVTPN